jgi:hypothetical protein
VSVEKDTHISVSGFGDGVSAKIEGGSSSRGAEAGPREVQSSSQIWQELWDDPCLISGEFDGSIDREKAIGERWRSRDRIRRSRR